MGLHAKYWTVTASTLRISVCLLSVFIFAEEQPWGLICQFALMVVNHDPFKWIRGLFEAKFKPDIVPVIQYMLQVIMFLQIWCNSDLLPIITGALRFVCLYTRYFPLFSITNPCGHETLFFVVVCLNVFFFVHSGVLLMLKKGFIFPNTSKLIRVQVGCWPWQTKCYKNNWF